jgi:hypothetical protein
MHASVRSYSADPAKMDELLHIADEEFVPTLRQEPGFCAYQMIDCGGGTLMTFTCFSDEAGIDRSIELAADFVGTRLADYDIERLDVKAGEIKVSLAAEQLLEPAHV